MKIIGRCGNSSVIIADSTGFTIVRVSDLKWRLDLLGDAKILVAQLHGGFSEYKASTVLTKKGEISKKCGIPLKLKEIKDAPTILGVVRLNGVDCGRVVKTRVISIENGSEVERTILYFPKLNEFITYMGNVGERNLTVLFSNVYFFNFCKNVSESCWYWEKGFVLDERLWLLGLNDESYVLTNFLSRLEEKKLVNIPYLNIKEKRLSTRIPKEQGTYLSCYTGELEVAWREMLTGKLFSLTRFEVVFKADGNYVVTYYKDYERLNQQVKVVLTISEDKVSVVNCKR